MRLPFVIAMNCLNGFFHSIYDEESLAEALLRMPDGGAVAAWASSSLTTSATQQLVNRELFRLLFRDGTLTLGEAAARAKGVVTHSDVRRSWIFFGDPATRLLGVQPGPDAGLVPVDTAVAASDPIAAAATAVDGGHMSADAGRRVRLADFDGDGRADLLGYRPDTGAWQTWTATGRVLDEGTWALGLDVQAADFDDDHLADLFLYDPLSGAWFQLVNTGAGFVATAGTTRPDADVRLGDLDGDGRDDVLLYQPATGDWSLGVADDQGFVFSTGHWTSQLTVRVADVDGDGRTDIVTYQPATGRVRVRFSTSNGRAKTVTGTTHPDRELLVAQVDGDGRADLLFYDQTTGDWETWVSPVPRRFVVGATGTWAPGLAVQLADLTGDGRDETLRYDPPSRAWTVTSLTPDASNAALTATGVGPAWATLASGDTDGDGLAELSLYQPQTGAVQLLDPERASRLQVISADWPAGWILQGYTPAAPLDVTSAAVR
jgi:hypothetical protein